MKKKSGFNYLFLRETEALKHLQVNYEMKYTFLIFKRMNSGARMHKSFWLCHLPAI